MSRLLTNYYCDCTTCADDNYIFLSPPNVWFPTKNVHVDSHLVAAWLHIIHSIGRGAHKLL